MATSKTTSTVTGKAGSSTRLRDRLKDRLTNPFSKNAASRKDQSDAAKVKQEPAVTAAVPASSPRPMPQDMPPPQLPTQLLFASTHEVLYPAPAVVPQILLDRELVARLRCCPRGPLPEDPLESSLSGGGDDARCLEGTRTRLAKEVADWVDDQGRNSGAQLLWLTGEPGTGKSTVARTAAYALRDKGQLAGAFFFHEKQPRPMGSGIRCCSRGRADLSDGDGIRGFFPSIAMQLARTVPGYADTLIKALIEAQIGRGEGVGAGESPPPVEVVAGMTLEKQFETLVLQPLVRLAAFAKALKPPVLTNLVFVIDGLNECEEDWHARVILRLMLLRSPREKTAPFNLRIFATSRLELFNQLGLPALFGKPGTWDRITLRHVTMPNAAESHPDIFAYLRHNLDAALTSQQQSQSTSPRTSGGSLSEETLQGISAAVTPSFYVASMVIRFVTAPGSDHEKRLARLLVDIGQDSTAGGQAYKVLSAILDRVVLGDASGKDVEEQRRVKSFQQTVRLLTILRTTLTPDILSRLLNIPIEDILCMVNDIPALFLKSAEDHVYGSNTYVEIRNPLCFRHYLLDSAKSLTESPNISFPVNEREMHHLLARKCFKLLSGPESWFMNRKSLGWAKGSERGSPFEIPGHIQYACRFWAHHLEHSRGEAGSGKTTEATIGPEEVYEFLREHMLHWVEVLAVLGDIDDVIPLVSSLRAICCSTANSANDTDQDEKDANVQLLELLDDTKRLIHHFGLAIRESPSQLYVSALIFAPESSTLRRIFHREIVPASVIGKSPSPPQNWDGHLRTLVGHTSEVNSVLFSLDGKQLVSGSGDNTVRLWDAETGHHLETIELEPCGLQGIKDAVNDAVFHPDSSGGLVVASSRPSVRVWNPAQLAPGRLRLEGHCRVNINAVAYSPDGALLASGSDMNIRLWREDSGTPVRTIAVSGPIRSLAFSPDGRTLASADANRTAQLWDVQALLADPYVGDSLDRTQAKPPVKSLTFSPDGKRLAVVLGDRRVRLLDVNTEAELCTVQGHSLDVNSAVFSATGDLLATASDDMTIKLWGLLKMRGAELGAAEADPLRTLEGHTSWVRITAFSPDGQWLASGSDDKTVRLWDVATGELLHTLEGHSDWVGALAFSGSGSGAPLLLASGSDDGTVRLWDCEDEGEAVLVLKGHDSWVRAVVFSTDGKRLASASSDRTVRVWDVEKGAVTHTFSVDAVVRSIWFSGDGQRIETDRGAFVVESAEKGSLPNGKGIDQVETSLEPTTPPLVFVKEEWIYLGDKRVVSLPPEYRASCSALSAEGILALGCVSGTVSFFGFGRDC